MVPVLLLGLALRLAPWDRNRFLEDEALYAYWGLQIASGSDPMLDYEPVDKPPLYPYALALSFTLFDLPSGSSREAMLTNSGTLGAEITARLPSLIASTAAIALVYSLGVALFNDAATGLLAAALVALSPFDILFASTVFTDPSMVALVLAALLAAAKGRFGLAGIAAGLATATKQQALFFLPLIVVVGALTQPRPPGTNHDGDGEAQMPRGGAKAAAQTLRRISTHSWSRFALGFAIVGAGVIWWDSVRVQRPGFFEQSLLSYGGLRMVQPEELGSRAVDWLRLVASFWVSPWFNGLVSCILLAWFAGRLQGLWSGRSRIPVALTMFVLLFLALHWSLSFQVWDRYLLGLVPLVALLLAQSLLLVPRALLPAPRRWFGAVGAVLVLACLLSEPLHQATRSELPLGGDHGAYDGIDELAAYLRTQAPPDSVLYHYWLGSHYRFYLYGAALRLHWYPDLDDLARDAATYRRKPRYIAFPGWRDGTPAMEKLASAGMELVPILETKSRDDNISLLLYRMQGP
jgi:hypothetical protein